MATQIPEPPEGDGRGIYRGWTLYFDEGSKRTPWRAIGPDVRAIVDGRRCILPPDQLGAASLEKLMAKIDDKETVQ